MTPSNLRALGDALSHDSQLPVQLLAETTSTNQVLLDSAAQLPLHPQAPCALIALKQSAGRGRMGRVWTAEQSLSNTTKQDKKNRKFEAGKNHHPAFLATIGIRTTAPIQELTMLPLHVGVAIAQTLNHWGCAAQLKWPNDLVINTQNESAKLGGILVETRTLLDGQTAIVIGMGLNWHRAPVLPDKVTACVLDEIHGLSAPNEMDASAGLLTGMALAWQRCIDGADCDFAKYDALYGHEIMTIDAKGAVQYGTATGINLKGHLGMRLANGQHLWLHSGEVSVRLKL